MEKDIERLTSETGHQPLSGKICIAIGVGFIVFIAAALATVRFLAGG